MNVTTKKSECDPKQRIRQLEVAIEHALAAATASHSTACKHSRIASAWLRSAIPVSSFAKLLRRFDRSAGLDGIWVVIDLGNAATLEASQGRLYRPPALLP